mgnify:CR=1 FL=1
MPRSRSRSFESITRSATCSFARNTPALAQHRVDQGRLAVVDVRDDRDVADVCPALRHEPAPRPAGPSSGNQRAGTDGHRRAGRRQTGTVDWIWCSTSRTPATRRTSASDRHPPRKRRARHCTGERHVAALPGFDLRLHRVTRAGRPRIARPIAALRGSLSACGAPPGPAETVTGGVSSSTRPTPASGHDREPTGTVARRRPACPRTKRTCQSGVAGGDLRAETGGRNYTRAVRSAAEHTQAAFATDGAPPAAEADGERRAVAGLARHDDRAAELLGEAPHDVEPEARAAEAPRLGAVGLAELLEDRVLVLRLDPDAGVAHLDEERAALRSALRRARSPSR